MERYMQDHKTECKYAPEMQSRAQAYYKSEWIKTTTTLEPNTLKTKRQLEIKSKQLEDVQRHRDQAYLEPKQWQWQWDLKLNMLVNIF